MWRPSRWPYAYREAAAFVAFCAILGGLGAWVGDLAARRHA